MSIIVSAAIRKTCLFQGNTLNVALAMADWAGDDGGDIFPGVDLLAATCRTSVRTVQSALKELVNTEVVEQVANSRGGRGRITEYRIDLERVQELHALHQAENPDCEWCSARRRSDEKRVQHRARRVQIASAKGADRRQKGENSGAPIDNNHQQPSNNLSPNGRGKDGSPSADEGAVFPEVLGWPAIWAAFLAIPGVDTSGFSEVRAQQAWLSLRDDDRPSDAEMIGCIEAYGRWRLAENAQRPPDRPLMVRHPHNWIKDMDFGGFLVGVRAAPKRVAGKVEKAQKPLDDMPVEIAALLRDAHFSDDEIDAWFGGVTFEKGMCWHLTVPMTVQAEWFGPNGPTSWRRRMEQAFGLDFVVDLAKRAA